MNLFIEKNIKFKGKIKKQYVHLIYFQEIDD